MKRQRPKYQQGGTPNYKGSANFKTRKLETPVVPDFLGDMNVAYSEVFANRQADKYNPEDAYKYDGSEKTITLNSGKYRGAKVPTRLVDNAIEAAKKAGADPMDFLALIGQESTFGAPLGNVGAKEASSRYLVQGWTLGEDKEVYPLDRYLADKKVPGVSVSKGTRGYSYNISDVNAVNEYLSKNPGIKDNYIKLLGDFKESGPVDYFYEAAKKYSANPKSYNAGDPDYINKIVNSKKLLEQDSALQRYLKEKGMYKYGGQRKKYQGIRGSSIVTTPLPSYMQQHASFVGQMLQEPIQEFNPIDSRVNEATWQTPGQINQQPTPVALPQPQQPQYATGTYQPPGTGWGSPNPKTILPLAALNMGVRAWSERYAEREQQDYIRQNLNNPYMGQLGSNNGRSDNVRFGYRQYQEGGEVDPLEELYEKLLSDIENENIEEVKKIEPMTDEQVEDMQLQEQVRIAKKMMGRQIVNDFNPMGDFQGRMRYSSSEASIPPNQAAQFAQQHYVSKGLPEHVAAGIVGNLMQESGLNPHVKGDGGKATGIAQWHPDRFKKLTKWADNTGRNPYDLQTQLDFVLEEPGEGQKALRALLGTNSAEEAAHVFSQTYERPNPRMAQNDKRAAFARGILGYAKGGTYYLNEDDLYSLQVSGVKYKIID